MYRGNTVPRPRNSRGSIAGRSGGSDGRSHMLARIASQQRSHHHLDRGWRHVACDRSWLSSMHEGRSTENDFDAGWKLIGRASSARKLKCLRYSSVSAASWSPDNRCTSVLMPICATSRARGAPGQPWTPRPKDNCPRSWRVMSRRSGSGNRFGSRLADRRRGNTC